MFAAFAWLYSHILTLIIDTIVAGGCAAAFGFIVGVTMGGIYDVKHRYNNDTSDEAPAIIFSALGAGILAFAVTIWMINVEDLLGTVISHQICNAVIGIVVAFIIYRLYARGKRNKQVNSQAKRRPF